MIRFPILTASVWGAIVGCGVAITLLALLIGLLERQSTEYSGWFLISLILGWNATVAACCFARGPVGWKRFVILPVAIIVGSAASSVLNKDLWHGFLPLLSVQALGIWLVSHAIGFPRWRTANFHDVIDRRFSISALIVLTTAVAGVFAAARIGDLSFIAPLPMVVLMVAAAGGWLLGSGTFCFEARFARQTSVFLLPVFCFSLWAFVQLVDIGVGHGEDFQLTCILPTTNFAVAAIIGFFAATASGVEQRRPATFRDAKGQRTDNS